MNKHKFELDDDVLLKKVYVYSMVDHPEFIVLVNKRSNQIVGMSLRLNSPSLLKYRHRFSNHNLSVDYCHLITTSQLFDYYAYLLIL